MLHQGEGVEHVPVLDDLPVVYRDDVDNIDVNRRTRWGDAHELAVVGPQKLLSGGDLVTFFDLFVNLRTEIGETANNMAWRVKVPVLSGDSPGNGLPSTKSSAISSWATATSCFDWNSFHKASNHEAISPRHLGPPFCESVS